MGIRERRNWDGERPSLEKRGIGRKGQMGRKRGEGRGKEKEGEEERGRVAHKVRVTLYLPYGQSFSKSLSIIDRLKTNSW